ncbi:MULTISPECIES: hypothetical protein [Citrobacter]|uniref:hypothetical protein n=1 Tax=Citrobacter TaxID=544 RepID=UPI0011EEE8D2|nr:hypothetical protein [Citrobacter braakii]
MLFFSVASSSLTDDVLMLLLMLSGPALSVCLGRMAGRYRNRSGSGTVLAVVSGLSVLLTGCAFFISVAGFAVREKAEVHEVQAVGRAWQYSGLLNEVDRERSRLILMSYLSERIHFFQENTSTGLRTWSRLARIRQQQLWQLAEGEVSVQGRLTALPVLKTYSDLGDCMVLTRNVWCRQLPDSVWGVLILLALSVCYLVGYRQRGGTAEWRTLLFVPMLMGLTLFVIAETDLPGQGIIHVTPDGLESLADELRQESR